MRCMQFFPNITVLFLAQQHLTDIEGLSSCPNLEVSSLSEASLVSARQLIVPLQPTSARLTCEVIVP